MKTIIYVDGYNLFYDCLKHSEDKWLDLQELLFKRIVIPQSPSSELLKIKFFTADIKAKVASKGQEASHSQEKYHRALENLYPSTIEIIKGFYSLEKANLLRYRKPPNKTECVDVWKLEEKN